MKQLMALIILLSTTISYASKFNIVCGDEHTRVTVLASRSDILSKPKVLGLLLNNQPAKYKSAFFSAEQFYIKGFGHKDSDYLNVYLRSYSCDNGKSIVGEALYIKYDAKQASSHRLVYKCFCNDVW